MAHLFSDHQIVHGEDPAKIPSHDPHVTQLHMRKELAPSQVLGQRDGLALGVPASHGIQATRVDFRSYERLVALFGGHGTAVMLLHLRRRQTFV